MELKNNRAPLLSSILQQALCIILKPSVNSHFESQSGNAQFGSKSTTFFTCATSKFNGWPWKITGHLSLLRQDLCIISKPPPVDSNLSYSLETVNSGENRWFIVACDLEIWLITLKNNRAHLLCCFKLCASFHSHQWIETGVTVRKRPNWVTIDDHFTRVTLKFDGWHWKTLWHLSKAISSFVHHFIIMRIQSGVAVRKRID